MRGKGVRIPCWVARSSNRWSGSIAKMKSMGESGSPWRMPLAWVKPEPCLSLSDTVEEAIRKRMEIHSRQRSLKHRACRASSK
jgi:hypothetical protein